VLASKLSIGRNKEFVVDRRFSSHYGREADQALTYRQSEGLA
jgi:hypothetical protein